MSDLSRKIWIPSSWIPSPLAKKINLTENAQSLHWVPNASTSPSARNQYILDRHECERFIPRSPILGPVQFNGVGETTQEITALLTYMKAYISGGGVCCAIRGATRSIFQERILPEGVLSNFAGRLTELNTNSIVGNAHLGEATGPSSQMLTSRRDQDTGTHVENEGMDSQHSVATGHGYSIAPPDFCGTSGPLPAGLLQLLSYALWGPVCVNWWRLQNTARTKGVLEHGFTLADATYSVKTGTRMQRSRR